MEAQAVAIEALESGVQALHERLGGVRGQLNACPSQAAFPSQVTRAGPDPSASHESHDGFGGGGKGPSSPPLPSD